MPLLCRRIFIAWEVSATPAAIMKRHFTQETIAVTLIYLRSHFPRAEQLISHSFIRQCLFFNDKAEKQATTKQNKIFNVILKKHLNTGVVAECSRLEFHKRQETAQSPSAPPSWRRNGGLPYILCSLHTHFAYLQVNPSQTSKWVWGEQSERICL